VLLDKDPGEGFDELDVGIAASRSSNMSLAISLTLVKRFAEYKTKMFQAAKETILTPIAVTGFRYAPPVLLLIYTVLECQATALSKTLLVSSKSNNASQWVGIGVVEECRIRERHARL